MSPATDPGRLNAAAVAAIRRAALSRWLVRLAVFDVEFFAAGDRVLGREGPLLLELRPSAGPGIAAGLVGRPVNYLVDEHGRRAGLRPNGELVKHVDARIAVGVVEHAWCDEHGVLGVLAPSGRNPRRACA